MAKSSTISQISRQAQEGSIRHRLGIPDDAGQVIIFAESSHWDPNWLHTSGEYFLRFVQPNLDRAIDELLREPHRIYSIECIYYLREYWEQRPEHHDVIRNFVNEGRLRLTSSGVTTADTLLPDAESILRDFLMGQEWLRANGMTQEPRVAYFPDSFGHSPALPSILKAAGFDLAAITRIDGMFFIGADYELPGRFPRPGSSAALLMEKERTLDFVWRGPDGAEVLCHWNAFTYGQGDLLAHRGINRVYLFPVAVPDRSDRNVAGKIERYAARLAQYARTSYLFCPIGFDFVGPIPDLVALLDRYNRTHYPATGIWACNAGVDDYLELVDCHREALPVLELDPNPYWTGFYTSRPTLKKRCQELVDLLLLAERLAVLPENDGAEKTIAKELEDAWWDAVVSNHHDFITGTSPDRVVLLEQQPWLERSIASASGAVTRLAPDDYRKGVRRPTSVRAELPEWRSSGSKIEIKTPHYAVELNEESGGGIVRGWCPGTGVPSLKGISNDLVSYEDSGGLWRMGHEFRGGALKEAARTSDQPARLQVQEHEDGLEASCVNRMEGEEIRRSLWFRSDSRMIRFRVEGRAAERRTVSVRFATELVPSRMVMDTPGGCVVRPFEKWYSPTFWSMQRFVHTQDDADGRGVALCSSMPGAVSCQPDGRIEMIALRNATRERAFGFLPLLAMPATGHEHSTHAFEYAILFTPSGDWRDNNISEVARSIVDSPWDAAGRTELRELAGSVFTTDRPDVMVTAVKLASRGSGIVVRLSTLTSAGSSVVLTILGRVVKQAFLCDARERDIEPLEVQDGAVSLIMPGNICTVRLMSCADSTVHCNGWQSG
jgi:hypothetical protein